MGLVFPSNCYLSFPLQAYKWRWLFWCCMVSSSVLVFLPYPQLYIQFLHYMLSYCPSEHAIWFLQDPLSDTTKLTHPLQVKPCGWGPAAVKRLLTAYDNPLQSVSYQLSAWIRTSSAHHLLSLYTCVGKELRWICIPGKLEEVAYSAKMTAVQLHNFKHYLKISSSSSSFTTRRMKDLHFCWKINKVKALLALRAKQGMFRPTHSSSQRTCSLILPPQHNCFVIKNISFGKEQTWVWIQVHDLDKLLHISKTQFLYL